MFPYLSHTTLSLSLSPFTFHILFSPLSPPLSSFSHPHNSIERHIKLVWERTGWDKLRLLFLASSSSSPSFSSPLSLLPKNVLEEIIQYLDISSLLFIYNFFYCVRYLIFVPSSSGDALVSYFKARPTGSIEITT